MNILHIGKLSEDQANGMNVVVPEHVISQSKIENVAFLNCRNIKLTKLSEFKNYFCQEKNIKKIKDIKSPFNKPDIVIFHGIYIPEYLKLSKEIRKLKIPYIIVPHCSLTENAQKIKPLKKKIGNILFFNKFIKGASAIQYLSSVESNMSKKFKNNSYIIGNGMDEPNIKKNNFSKKGLKLIYVGRYDIYHKGIDLLINACKTISDYMRKESIIIELYGKGTDEEKIKKMIINNELSDIIKVNGPIYGLEKLKIITSDDMFIQTSRLEGQPLGIMEAMYLGMPIIATEGTTFKEIIKENSCGFSCTNDYNKISQQIVKMNENKNILKKFSQNSYKYAKNNFCWNIISKQSIQKYKEINND